jgi:valyl-tRNA synthetase
MYFQCCYIDNSISIKNVFVHGLLRAEDGRKMTKSLNNGIDPMDIVDKYGVDPMRIGMLSRTVSGEDMNYSTQSIEYA